MQNVPNPKAPFAVAVVVERPQGVRARRLSPAQQAEQLVQDWYRAITTGVVRSPFTFQGINDRAIDHLVDALFADARPAQETADDHAAAREHCAIEAGYLIGLQMGMRLRQEVK
jgi:hypothetical protein